MTYKEFKDYVVTRVKEIKGDQAIIKINKISKNNGVILDGLAIIEDGRNYSPTIYLNGFYTQFTEGESLDELIDDIMEIYEDNKNNLDIPDNFFMEFESVRDNICFKLVNYSRNEELLMDVPHRRWNDLAIIYYVICDTKNGDRGTVIIHNNHVMMWEVDEEELFISASINTKRFCRPSFRPINEIVKEMYIESAEQSGMDYDEIIESLDRMAKENPMYVLTNEYKNYGSICMLYDGLLDNITNIMKTDVYIIPSSIHEVIIVPKRDDISYDYLIEMVRSVNTQELAEEEILSDTVYVYTRDSGFVEIDNE